jgi:superfamily II DNA or RNA helicase
MVNATFRTDEMQELLATLNETKSMLISDECHHFRSILKNRTIKYDPILKLGLSATPYHYIDNESNRLLKNYFGCADSFYKYELKNALDDNILTPYYYYPNIIYLTEQESQTYVELSKQIAQAYAISKDHTSLDYLYRKRTELIAVAEGKVIALKNLLTKIDKSPLTLFYCGVDSLDLDDERQVEIVCKIIEEQGMSVMTYTSNENSTLRKHILSSFRDGNIDALVAMKCLDEGVDIPGCLNAHILASSRDPRQFIQRRGRVLRKSADKEFSNIYDYLVIPPDLGDDASDIEIGLAHKEMERAFEFAALAKNATEAKTTLLPLAVKYNLTHLL